MPRLTFDRIAEMAGGRVVRGGDLFADSVVIDSRKAAEGAVFFAIRGERLDGHDFLVQALESGAGAVVEQVPEGLPADRGIVQVDDTTRALQALARSIRNDSDVLLIGVTGSTGKTTTKEMIASLIGTSRKVWRSWGNFNNHIGLPLCLSNMPEETEVVVSEMGMSAKGEIEFLARLAGPNIGVYTNIRPVHLEFFDSIDGIAAAKRELLENVRQGGSIVINADDERVVGISEGFPGRKVTYGVEKDAEFRALEVRSLGLLGTELTLRAEGSERRLSSSLPGRYNLENLLAAIATARMVGIGWDEIESAAAALQPAEHRGVVVKMRGLTVYDDCYNSNPYALGRALELMSEVPWEGRRIAVVGDMLELGGDELEFHREAGRAIPSAVDVIVAVGRRSKALIEGAGEAGFASDALHHFDDAEAAGEFLDGFVRPGDLVLLKASRGIGLDRILTRLEREA